MVIIKLYLIYFISWIILFLFFLCINLSCKIYFITSLLSAIILFISLAFVNIKKISESEILLINCLLGFSFLLPFLLLIDIIILNYNKLIYIK